MEWLAYIVAALSVLALILVLLLGKKGDERMPQMLELLQTMRQDNAALQARQDMLTQTTDGSMQKMITQLSEQAQQQEQKLDHVRRALQEGMHTMQQGNAQQLETIRRTVDEKLQSTLDKKLNESFQLVSTRLEQVYKGLGEMQTLAAGVGDLKKVLSNVKTRGILGEFQLGAILEQMLSPDQYACNVATKRGSQANVEYAIKLPGQEGAPVWLPVDAKFPVDAYEQLLVAYDTAQADQVAEALKQLKNRVKAFAKEIQSKYIDPPNTTDFAIMFLPTEGLYAELVRAGMVETLQQTYKVNLAGPTTMGALLNSLQMGFQTLAIQKRSSEVWQVLGAVKQEFETFAGVLEKTKTRLNQPNDELDKLVGVRTRQIQRTLKQVQALPSTQAEGLIAQTEELDV